MAPSFLPAPFTYAPVYEKHLERSDRCFDTDTSTEIIQPVQAIGKNNNTRTVQAESSKFASLLFDQRFQIDIPPRIVANVPELIGKPYDGNLH